MKTAQFLQDHPLVDWVSYPGLESHESYELAQTYLPKGQGAILTFGIKGGREAGKGSLILCSFSPISQTWAILNPSLFTLPAQRISN